jgi:transcriptional regulator with XRE-family HTH domain
MPKNQRPKRLVGRPAGPGNNRSLLGRLGQRLRQRRLALDMTLEEVAAGTGGLVSASMLCQYELGRTEPRLLKYLAACMVLGIGATDLLPAELAELQKR